MEKQVEEFYLNSYRTNTNDTVTAVVERVAFGGHDFFVLIQPLPIPGKKIALVHPAATILTAFQTLRTSFLIGAFIALILLFLVNFYANVRLFKPLQHLIKIACDAPQEDFKILSSGKKRSEIKCMLEILNKSLTQFKALNKINIDKIISERKKLEHIIEQMVGGILIIDPENRIIICNNLFAQWHNLDKRNLINKKLSEITGLNMYQDMINNLIWEKSSEIKQQRILLDSGKNGINRTLEANATNIFTSGKTFIATSIYVRDITKEHEIDKLKSELVSTVAHELRSPIVSIIGFSEILLEDTIKENEHKEYLRIIQKESSRLSAFIDNFLDLTRIESGTMPLNKKESDFNKTVKQVLNLYKSQAMQKSIRFKTYFEKPVFVHKYDTFLIERVIGNYLSNAIKYSQPYTFISVKTYSKEGHLYFEVIDNGIGISESDLEKIFDKFYRVPVKNDDMPKGSGLGLSFVKEAIAKHEGDVFVRSKLGEGSIFGFKLPLDIE
ncbi:MAG TPA: PAS domain-containing sensor histidine kinase [Caldithrix abyssi]|uniref:histidine kinase n=1 Tax=Caldithrix abyssi TaxID=187145 RepID=A0A7V4WVR7_CALAY|nr:PAS domain-containing sensor histidine kinase [Caldithrix abyssi]